MRRNLAYLKYVLLHKWYVFVAGRLLGVSLWRLIKHDWTKFTPAEWGPYARTFYNEDGTKKKYAKSAEFDAAWLHHQNWNDHHPEWWVGRNEQNDAAKAFEMSEMAVREMVSDWAGAGRGITGKWEVKEWFEKNSINMFLDSNTRKRAVSLVGNFQDSKQK